MMHREDVERIWPERLKIRDTGLHDDLGGPGQRIYTTAGRGYERVEYVRADLIAALMAERDAAFAAGQEEMRRRAVAAAVGVETDHPAWVNTGSWACAAELCGIRINDLPIKDKPDDRQ